MFSDAGIPFIYSTFNGSYRRFPGHVLFKWNGIKNVPMVFVGFSNFKAVITDAMFWHSIKILCVHGADIVYAASHWASAGGYAQ